MKILWVCSLPLPEMAAQLHLNQTSFGGWLIGLSRQLENEKSVSLHVLANVPSNIGEISGKAGGYSYYTFTGLSNCQSEPDENRIYRFRNVIQSVHPDVIHVFGSEYSFCQEMVMAAEAEHCGERVVISLQGLMKEYASHYTDGLSEAVIHHQTLREKIKKQSIAQEQQLFFMRSRFEEYALRHVSHVIGRTDWDHQFARTMNPDIQYHYCSETLRPEFYGYQWENIACRKNTIFISQASYPIKGFHLFLKAMPALSQRFPDLQVYVTGRDLVHLSMKEKFHLDSYRLYLHQLIRQLHLEGYLTFCGTLDAEQMRDHLLSANAFVSPSVLENSSNSIGEAMLVGTPVIASDTGGTCSMIPNSSCGLLYPLLDTDALIEEVSSVFSDPHQCQTLSKGEKRRAAQLFDPAVNQKQLLSIYQSIAQEEK
ncbi:glycosyltransferase [Galactobacillus timonensis]|uniref:glycosyltransferase family 4 protein n=1 Tax=Galactobacillus timonensis TaxID=2041840 RepID=UPI00240A90E3|nr:glycosyltransferase [Galactobacillus timonensis]MDD6370713.1 glycosyltransferase [Galactobacillus timonensis]